MCMVEEKTKTLYFHNMGYVLYKFIRSDVCPVNTTLFQAWYYSNCFIALSLTSYDNGSKLNNLSHLST